MNFSTPIEKIPGIGPAYLKKLNRLNIKTVQDILFHFPHRYQDFSKIVSINQVKIGEEVCIKGEIKEIKNIRTWKKRMILTTALIEDKSGAIKAIWFNQPYLINILRKKDFLYLAGKISVSKEGIYLSNPVYEKMSNFKNELSGLTHTGRLVPVYPETEGLSSRWLRNIIKRLLKNLKNKIDDPLPEKIRLKYGFFSLEKSLWQIHFPQSFKSAQKAKERFAFEELFYLSLSVLREKLKLCREKSFSVPINLEIVKQFIEKLPFTLTQSQKKAIWQILKDLEKERPMNRLLEGDVGSGKTVVAIVALLNVAKNGYQGTLMAPTEILSKQHYQNVFQLLKDFKLEIGLLTGKEIKLNGKKIKRNNLLKKLLEGKIDILIGTHSLIEEKVKFGKLALVVLDEQHRFGVEQRAKLLNPEKSPVNLYEKKERKIPHLLSMTATPIPRTLALTLYGDLDLTLLKEMPKGRKKIITQIVPPEKRNETYQFIKNEVKKGRQVFVVCPRIEPSSKEEKKFDSRINNWKDAKAVKKEYEKLTKIIFPDLKVAMLHGKMKKEEKEEVMEKFKKRKFDILVSTSVIEVGVDVPNVTVMMIEGAEHFGLAQLHQFRGRVGRGEHQSFCFLFIDSSSLKTQKRLKALLESEDGFALAEKDLEIRGPGEILGNRQWGLPDLTMSSLQDVFLVEKTREEAKEILREDPLLKKYSFLKKKIEEFERKIHLE